MPAKRGAHTYFDKSRQQWQIRDAGGYIQRLSKASIRSSEEADKALAVYIADKPSTPEMPTEIDDDIASNIKLVGVARVLTAYCEAKKDDEANRVTIGYHVPHLIAFFGAMTLSQIKKSTCQNYVAWRVAQTYRAPGSPTEKNVSDQTAARELATLSAAIGVWHGEHTLLALPKVWRPDARTKDPDWLTETEVGRLIKIAEGYRWYSTDRRTREPIWTYVGPRNERLVRFIKIGFYQGSRTRNILSVGWVRDPLRGHFDLVTRTYYRTGAEAKITRKRAPKCRIHDELFPSLKKWREADKRKGVIFVINEDGQAIDRIDQSFATAARHAHLDVRDIDGAKREKLPTPHILRHTRATLMLLKGRTLEEVARYLGMSVEMVEDTYGHTHNEYQKAAASS